MTTPAWWPQVVDAAYRRRNVTGQLLTHATPSVDGGVLRLQFTAPAVAAAWGESGAQAALEGALHACGQAMPIEIVSLTV